MRAHREGEAGAAGDRGRHGHQQHERAGEPDHDLERIDHQPRQLAVEGGHDPDERGLEPLLAELRRAALGRERADTDDRDEHREDDDEPDRGEERARQRASGLACLLGEVRDRLEPRVREEPERDRRRAGRRPSPARARAGARRRAISGEKTSARPSTTISALHGQVEERDDERRLVQARAPGEPDDPDHGDRDDARHDVPGRVADAVEPERRADVVRHEERGEGDHDQVVEEERPARDEADEVVEGAPRERLGAADLRDRRGALRVGERDEPEDDARDGEDDAASARAPPRRRCRARRRSRPRSPRTRSRRAPGRPAPARSRGPSVPPTRPSGAARSRRACARA